MSNQTDLTIIENFNSALIRKDDLVTISAYEKNNQALESELDGASAFLKEKLKTAIRFNKMMIKRLQTGKY